MKTGCRKVGKCQGTTKKNLQAFDEFSFVSKSHFCFPYNTTTYTEAQQCFCFAAEPVMCMFLCAYIRVTPIPPVFFNLTR